jgi:muramidase (phage lysozyme)
MPTVNQHLEYLKMPTVKAWLDTIAWAESGKSYYTLFGGGTFSGNQHPNRAITANGYTSTAAGRYQFLFDTWRGIQRKLGLTDFSPVNQDIAALELTAERGALNYVINGQLQAALQTLGCAWAALPFATCKQRMRSFSDTLNYYNSRLKFYQGGNSTGIVQGNFLTMPSNNNNTQKDYTPYYILGALGLVLILKI